MGFFARNSEFVDTIFPVEGEEIANTVSKPYCRRRRINSYLHRTYA